MPGTGFKSGPAAKASYRTHESAARPQDDFTAAPDLNPVLWKPANAAKTLRVSITGTVRIVFGTAGEGGVGRARLLPSRCRALPSHSTICSPDSPAMSL